mgnify:FL=1
MTLLPQGVRALEEFDDELDGFEAGERAPSGAYFGGGGADGTCGGFGCFGGGLSCSYKTMPYGRQCCRGRFGGVCLRRGLVVGRHGIGGNDIALCVRSCKNIRRNMRRQSWSGRRENTLTGWCCAKRGLVCVQCRATACLEVDGGERFRCF